MTTVKRIFTSIAVVAMLAFTFGCQPAAKVDTSTSTSAGGSNATTNSNATAGSETPTGETP